MGWLSAAAAERRMLAGLEGLAGGRLTLALPGGRRQHFGSGGVEVGIEVRDSGLWPLVAARGVVGLGEGWAAGMWHSDALEPALRLLAAGSGLPAGGGGPLLRLETALVAAAGARGARACLAHHLAGPEFYGLWLDRGMHLSAAEFATDGEDLEPAQARAAARILAAAGPGERLLEIGCGFGALAEAAAERGRRVTALAETAERAAYADARLDGRGEVRRGGLGAATGRYDAVVAVAPAALAQTADWGAALAAVAARLAPGGRVVLQLVALPDAEYGPARRRPDFLRRHVLPGARPGCGALVARGAEAAGLAVVSSQTLALQQARTLRAWGARLAATRRQALSLGMGERGLRGWEFALAAAAAALATGRLEALRLVLAHAGEVAARAARAG